MLEEQGTGLVYVALVSMFFIGLVLGGVIIFFFRRMAINRQLRNAQRKAARTVAEARDESKDILKEAKLEIEKNKAKNEAELRERRSELQKAENRLSSKTESLERRLESLEQRDRNIANKEKEVPDNYITADGYHITDDFRMYALPLIEGEAVPPFQHGLPDYVRLNKNLVPPKT